MNVTRIVQGRARTDAPSRSADDGRESASLALDQCTFGSSVYKGTTRGAKKLLSSDFAHK